MSSIGVTNVDVLLIMIKKTIDDHVVPRASEMMMSCNDVVGDVMIQK